MYVIKADGRKENFNFSKIVRTALRAGVPKSEAYEIADEVEKQAYEGITTREVLDMILEQLHDKRISYASKYDLKGALMRLGPSGFTFEKLIAEMFGILGCEVRTNVIAQGRCVSHEVDVAAKRNDESYMIECKYRNFPGAFIGIQKALYVWARFKDLEKGYEMGKCERFDVPYLITNTKFSDQSIKYASCVGLRLKGWNFPHDESISDILTKNKIYPVTVLRSVNARTLKLLADSNYMLCRDLSEDKLIKIGISKRMVSKIMAEVAGVIGDHG